MTGESAAVPTRSSLARGAAVVTIATAISRLTGFVRVVVVAGAMGTTFLANTYQTANTAPNVLFELVAAGVLTSIFVPTFIEYLVRGEEEEAWRTADILTSAALVALTCLAIALAFCAPLVMRLLTLGVESSVRREQEIALGTTFLRLFTPQIVFYGAGMIMTGALHAHRRFALAAIAPVLNNVVVIGVYVAYTLMRGSRPPTVSGITTAETVLLGAGTTMGVVAMTMVLVPKLRELGWRYRWRFDPRHPALRRAARLGAWALSYAGGYQAGLIVVLLLANRIEGGVAAYQWAYTFFYVPHALIAMPVFSVLFPQMAEHATRREEGEFGRRLQGGLDMLAFCLVPVALLMVIAAGAIARVTLDFGVMTTTGAILVGRVMAAFALGLPAYSAFLVFTRAYYAFGDTRTPALVNAATVAVASAIAALAFAWLPPGWAVAGLALGHSVGFSVGCVAMARLLGSRVGVRSWLTPAVRRSLVTGVATLVVMVVAHALIPDGSRSWALADLALTMAAGAAAYLLIMKRLRSPELARLEALVFARH